MHTVFLAPLVCVYMCVCVFFQYKLFPQYQLNDTENFTQETLLIIRRTKKNCSNYLCEVGVWFSGSSELTIKAYSWFFIKVYKVCVDISYFISHTILGEWYSKYQPVQHKSQPIRTDVVGRSEWMLVVNNCCL